MVRLRKKLEAHCRRWIAEGLPSREALQRAAAQLSEWKKQNEVTGIWSATPLLLTATLDDGIGQGIEIIQIFSEVVGMSVKPLGLLQPPEQIIAACLRDAPAFLGLTVLQIDSEEALARIGHRVPAQTRIIAGGPAFKYDSEMAARHHVSGNVADYIHFLLNLTV